MATAAHIKSILLLSFLTLILAIISPVSADNVTITFSTVDFDTNQEILVYNSAGEFIGEYSMDDTFDLNVSYSYLFIYRPTTQSWFSNPLNSIEFIGIQMPVFLSYLVWVVAIVGIILII